MANRIQYVLSTKPNGFSFIELMIAMAILCITTLAAFGVMISQKKSFKVEEELTEMSQNTRVSLDILIRELRMSGYKVLEEQFLDSLSDWISSEYLPDAPNSVDLSSDDCPIITHGDGNAPDMITLFIADTKENTILNAINSGDSTITLDPNSQGYTDSTKFKVNDIIRIGDNTEFAKIISVSGHTLTIDTDPSTAGNQGMADNHPSGEPLREVNIITYTVFNEDNDSSYEYHTAGHPVLKRKHNDAEYVEISEGIEDFQIIPHAPPRYKVKMITRTSTQADYVEGAEDGYKRTELLADFRIRNYIKPQCLPPQIPTITSVTGLDSSYPCTIHVTWAEVTQDMEGEDLSSECGITDYIVTYANTAETRFYTAYPGTSTSCELNISSILRDPNHQTYYISVVAVNSSGLSAYPSEQTISDSSPPTTPNTTDFSAIAEGHAITLSWTDQPDCDVAEYHIYRSIHDASGGDEIARIPVIDSSVSMTYSYRDENLPCDTYYYRIKAYDYTYWSNFTTPVQETIIDSNAPAEPTNFSFTKGTDSLVFSWNLSSDDPFGSGEGDGDVTEYSICLLGTSLCLSIPSGQTSIHFDTNNMLFTYNDFSIQSKDICGNLSNAVTQPTECQDAVIVSLSYSCPSGSSCDWSETIDIFVTASSSNTLIQGELKFDNGAWIPLEGTPSWSYSLNASTLGVGTHIVTARVKDSADCIGTALLPIEVHDSAGSDVTPPVFGDIIQDPATSPVPADQNVSLCLTVTDESGIYSVILSTDFEETITMTVNDPNQGDLYCGTIPSHNESTVNYTITATDNTSNQNQATISSGYTQD